MTELSNIRNVGISAHIDSGKTTLTERILFYSGKIHEMGEVHESEATMDHMDLERERGITITSAATTVSWSNRQINIIDTPGHVDFTVEVERSLRVLDGAILVLCGVAGVQSQSITVDRQMKRYQVPRIAFINKLDRVGADPVSVMAALEEKLDLTVVPLQMPIGLGDQLEGVIDLVTLEAVYFEGKAGETIKRVPIPAELRSEAEAARAGMLDTLSLFDDGLMEMMLEEKPIPQELIHTIIRRHTITNEITPVLMGSAYKNKGVQLLLDAICRYLPSPLDREVFANDNQNDGAEVPIQPDPDGPAVAMAFKLVDESFGQLTYTRLYSGTIRRGDRLINARTGKEVRFSRLVRMHANSRADVDLARAGDIFAVVGVECASGDTFCASSVNLSLESIQVAEPVIALAIAPARTADRDKLAKALNRFTKEDPTFHTRVDHESGETLISGMGELHLEIYTERIRREYNVELNVGRPKVSYREAPTKAVEFNYKHRKQTGGSGQYAHVVGRVEPLPEGSELPYEFENKVFGGRIPTEYIPSCDKGFRSVLPKGPVAGFPIIGVRVVLEDGSSHPVDSSDIAFQICARDAFKEAFLKSGAILLEPIMKVEVETPSEYQGGVTGDLASRRGLIVNVENRGSSTVITTEVPLCEMFGYATDVRSLSQGKAGFSMEFLAYRRVPTAIQEEVVAAARAVKK
ncbi:MAG: elongation factor G [Phycisphaerae bacterium]